MCCLRNSIPLFDGEMWALACQRRERKRRNKRITVLLLLPLHWHTNFFIFHKFKHKRIRIYYHFIFITIWTLCVSSMLLFPTRRPNGVWRMAMHYVNVWPSFWNFSDKMKQIDCYRTVHLQSSPPTEQPIRWSVRSACECCSAIHISPSRAEQNKENRKLQLQIGGNS